MLCPVWASIETRDLKQLLRDFDEHLGIAKNQMVHVAHVRSCVDSTWDALAIEGVLDFSHHDLADSLFVLDHVSEHE